MTNKKWNKTWIGVVFGLISPVLLYAGYYMLMYKLGLKKVNVGLCMAINLLPFYLFIKKENDNAAKGVLLATFIWAAIIIFLSFFTDFFRVI